VGVAWTKGEGGGSGGDVGVAREDAGGRGGEVGAAQRLEMRQIQFA
jgi:hypothetical protein